MKNATVGSKTAKDYPIGTRFRWQFPGGHWYELVNHRVSNVRGCCEMRVNGRHNVWIDYNDATFSGDSRVEIVYPKSDNFNLLYEKLSNR